LEDFYEPRQKIVLNINKIFAQLNHMLLS
jgi:hypothetical protein